MKPYYQDDIVTLYHGDSKDVVGSLDRPDAVVTDPPYGINAARKRNSEKWGWQDFDVNGWDVERPEPWLLRGCVEYGKVAIVWGGNYFPDILPMTPRNKWLIWDKGQTDFSLADCEMAWCSWDGAIRRISYARGAALKDGKEHPTQKPEAVMAWTLKQLPDGIKTILDPFAGTGTTLVEAKRIGLSCAGIEREERYCEIAARRLSQGALPMEFVS